MSQEPKPIPASKLSDEDLFDELKFHITRARINPQKYNRKRTRELAAEFGKRDSEEGKKP